MANFPDTFAEQLQPLPDDLGEAGNAAAAALAEKGFVVMAGLTRNYVGALTIMAAQRETREYCPKDPTEARFATEESTEKWLSKNGGRGMFLLLERLGDDALDLAGYGWTGLEESEEVPGGETTFAIRIGEHSQGLGLATPFTKLIVAGSARLFGARNIWLETWKGNGKAVGAYNSAGFAKLDVEKDDYRPTTRELFSLVNGRVVVLKELKKGEGKVPAVADTRLYFSFPNELLPAA